MNDTVNQLMVLKRKLEEESKEEFLKYLATCKAQIEIKDLESELEKYFKEYNILISDETKFNTSIPK